MATPRTVGPTVRQVRRDEFPALAKLTVAAYRGVLGDALGGPYLAELADVTAQAEAGVVVVAVDERGELLGGVTYLSCGSSLASVDDAGEAVIRYLGVAPEAQGRGVGAALVASCVARARAEGKARVALHTTGAMATAQRLYERAGFRRDPGHDRELESSLILLSYVLDLDGGGAPTRPA